MADDGKRYSTEGPICPHCDSQATADEPFYYDEALTKLECSDCGRTFAVRVYIETSWTTEPLMDKAA